MFYDPPPPPVHRTVRAVTPTQRSTGLPTCVGGRAEALDPQPCSPPAPSKSTGNGPRMPDYWSFNFSGTPFSFLPFLQVNVNLTITRNWHVFAGGGVGIAPIPGFQASARAGWINQAKAPSASSVDNFVGGRGVTADFFYPELEVLPDVGLGGSVAETWGYPGAHLPTLHQTATELGVGIGGGDNISVSYNYLWRIG
jgi:hypothetical protein